MWVIISKEGPEKRYMLMCGREYSLGRKDTDIVLENDMSISRKHAVLRASHSVTDVPNPKKVPMLTVQDLSKIGTMVGETRYVKDSGVVNSGDTVWFGNLQNSTSKYQALYEAYIATTSCLEATAKKSTRQHLSLLGGHLVNEWRKDCDVLIMSNLSITIKAICALIAQKPIVTPEYLDDWLKALDKGTKQPNPHDYLPPLAESQVDPKQVTFDPDVTRLTIFQGQVFIFLTNKQFKKLSVAVELGGGTPLLLDEKSEDVDLLYAPGSCVMSCDPNDQSQQLTVKAQNWIKHVLDLLHKHKKRPITESEVGFAVLYCSTQQHCNPDADLDAPGVGTVPVVPQTLSQYVDVTQPQNTQRNTEQSLQPQASKVKVKSEPVSQKTEAETVSYSALHSDNRKRARLDGSDTEGTPAKKSTITRGARGLKQEIVTPQKPLGGDNNNHTKPSTTGNRNHRSSSPEAPRRSKRASPAPPSPKQSRSKSPSPAPSSPKQIRRSARKSPSPAPPSPEPVRRNTRKHSPSPTPTSPKQTRRNSRKSPSPVPPNPKSQRKNIKRRSPSPDMYEAETAETESNTRVVSKMDSSEEETTHCRKPGKKPQKTFSSNEEVGSSGGEDDMFASIPKRKGHGKSDPKSARKAGKDESPERAVPARNIRHRVTKPEPDVSIVREEVPVPQQNVRPYNQDIKPVLQSRIKAESEPAPGPVDSESTGSRVGGSYTGFISKDKAALAVHDEAIDKDVAVYSHTMTEYVSLLHSKPKPAPRPQHNGTTKWKGKVVKNFKKFSKVERGDQALPHIIGGMDLFVHENNQSQKHDEWLQEYVQDHPVQNDKKDDDDDDLFNFATRRTATTSRKGRR